jgi:hypothetical protein
MTEAHWVNDASGDFATAANWSDGAAPGPNDEAILDPAGSASFTVTSLADETINSLQTATTATLVIGDTTHKNTFEVAAGTDGGANAGNIVNNGILVVSGTVDNSGSIVNNGILVVSGTVDNSGSIVGGTIVADISLTLVGGGTFDIAGGMSGIHDATFTNIDDTITGSGAIGGYPQYREYALARITNGAEGLIDAVSKEQIHLGTKNRPADPVVNAGTIEAMGAGSIVYLQSSITNSGVVLANGGQVWDTLGAGGSNTGIVEVTNGGGMRLNGTLDNAGGDIFANHGTIVFFSGRIAGGTLETGAGGAIQFWSYNVSTLDGSTSAVTIDGAVAVNDRGDLQLRGAIVNTGTITLAGSTGVTKLVVDSAAVTLSGGGIVKLDAAGTDNQVCGVNAAAALVNVDNHILGAGLLGANQMRLVNDAAGAINCNVAGTLIINTGAATIMNAGEIAATNGGTVVVVSALNETASTSRIAAAGGTIVLDGAVTGAGLARINGGTIDFAGAYNGAAWFTGTSGALILAHSLSFTSGTITGFSKTGGTSLDLRDIAFAMGVTKASFVENGRSTAGVLTVTDGTHTANIILAGDYADQTFAVAADGHGGTTVTDPPPPPALARFAQGMAAMAPAPATSAGHLDGGDLASPPRLARPGRV